MQNDQQTHAVTLKRIIVGLAGLVAIIVVGLGVALLLKNITNKTTVNLSHQVSPLNPADTIEAYIAQGSRVAGLSDDRYQQQKNAAETSIIYESTNHPYAINISTNYRALFYAKNKLQQDDTKTIQDQTMSFMQEKGYSKVESPASSVAGAHASAVYTNQRTICQLTDSGPVSDGSSSYHMLACVGMLAVIQEYATVENLLTLYEKSYPLPTFTQAIRSSISEGDKALSIINLTTPKKHPLLLFTAINNNWTYIGDLNGGKASNGKYAITPEINAALHNPKYGNFLTKNIH